ncbi:MAG TPA: hypothetical protein VKQ09_05860 [Sphingomonas sp.]|nr:hypothetical protein [Sphingomonas sp.]
MSRINLGDKVRDRLSGYEGICTAKVEYLTGCDQVGIKMQGHHDGKTYDTHYFDAPFVEMVEAGVVSPVVPRATDAGALNPPGRRG